MSMSTTSTTTLPTVVVHRNRQSKSFREGNPLVFTKSIQKVKDEDKTVKMASLVQVSVQEKNNNSQIIGWGVYNPHSMYRIRILCHALGTSSQLRKEITSASSQEEALAHIVKHQLRACLNIRIALGLLNHHNNTTNTNDSLYTDTFRLVNGEGDGLSGLAVDVIGGQVAVVMSSAAWCQVHKNLIITCLQEVLQEYNLDLDIVWKTTPARLKQDGMQEQLDDDSTVSDSNDKQVIATELGIHYTTYPYQQGGQKTGYYCDQRENRFALAQYCDNKRVLDLCCYHGGFALNAVIHGNAQHVVGVDSSQDAINVCNRNAKLNECSDKMEFCKLDISKYMKQVDGEEFDVIVLDPPKLAPSASGLDRAKRKYHGLNRDAIKLVNKKKGGIFMTCTCSAAMTQKDGGQYFLKMVQQASLAAGRRITLLRTSGAASCHTQSPASYPAGSYLTAAVFYVSPSL